MESFCISNLNLKIKFCEICCHDSDWKEHKTKTEYTLWMVEEGNIIIDYKKTKNEVFPGDIVFFYPGQAYNAFCTTKSCKFLVVFFRMDTNTMIHSIETQELSGIYRNSSSLAKRLIRTHKKYPA